MEEHDMIKRIDELTREVNHWHFKLIHKKLVGIGLYPGQQTIINVIAQQPGIIAKEICDLTNRKPSTIAASLKRLHNKGYIIVKKDINNNKIKRVYLNDLGKEAYQKFISILCKTNEDIVSVLSLQEINNLYSIIKKIHDKLEKEND